MIKKVLILMFFLSFFILILEANANNGFNPSLIISDAEILDNQTMTLHEIQSFLDTKNSFLANYSCPDANGIVRRASEIIYNASTKNYDCDNVPLSANPTEQEKSQKCKKITINPKFLLVLLQKEQSLIEATSPTQSRLDWATGYGCPDGGGCNVRWKGFGKQVNSAALQFFDYMINPNNYTYQNGRSYTFSNPYSTTVKNATTVTIGNNATAALYNYTPHVYNGNYNFYNIWQRYFTRLYPDGSLVQAKGENTVWLIQHGKKRAFLSKGALTSRFDINKVIPINSSDLDKYETGAPIKFAQYSFLRSPKGTVFLLVDDKKHGFVNQEALRKVGVNPEEIINATWDEINVYSDGKHITPTSTYLFGALLQNKKTGGVYWVIDGTKAALTDPIYLKTRFIGKKIAPVSSEELDRFSTISPVIFTNGELLKTAGKPGVYIIVDGYRRPFSSGEIFEKLGYKWSNIITVPEKILLTFPLGTAVAETGLVSKSASTTNQVVSEMTISPDQNSSTTTSDKATTTNP